MNINEEIDNLKRILYDMDILTVEEYSKAKDLLNSKITRDITPVERLKLMIPIKQQIVGLRSRKFNVGKYYARAQISENPNPIIYAKLIDKNKIQLSGHTNAILIPCYHEKNRDGSDNINIISSYIEPYNPLEGNTSYGSWRLSNNFKILKWEHNSDKNWKYDKSFSEIKE